MARVSKNHIFLFAFFNFFFTFSETKFEKNVMDASVLADLPLEKLLRQRKALNGGRSLDSLGKHFEALHRQEPSDFDQQDNNRKKSLKNFAQKIFYEEYHDEDKGWSMEKKEKQKIQDVLYTSVTALSYLAFGGYLLCMVVGALREKKRKFATAYPYAYSIRPQSHPHLTHVLQQYVAQKPVRVKFPTVTVANAGKKRRKRFSDFPFRGTRPDGEIFPQKNW